MVKADLHNHLRTSSRYCNGDFNKAVDLACKRLGSGAVLGLVNFHDWRYENFINSDGYEIENLGDKKNGVYVPEKDVYIVKGQEVSTKQGHLLVFGIGEKISLKEKKSLEYTLNEAKEMNGIIIADHPFSKNGIGNYLEKNLELLGQLDAIEVYNGESSFGLPFGLIPSNANKKAQEFYNKNSLNYPNLGAIASSDGHSMYEIGSSWTEIQKPKKEDFVNSLRDSITKTNLETPKKIKSSVVGVIDHILDLIFISKISPKIGLDYLFETERPE